MNYFINGKEYTYTSNIKDDVAIRQSFNQLSVDTFKLSFEDWYQSGYWGSKCIAHALLDGDCVVANIFVNIIDIIWQGEKKVYIQLGTVMTHADYRKQGLSKWLVENIFEEWKGKYDAMYLFANNSVLDFYPKFGFVEAKEYQCQISTLKAKVARVRKLDMKQKQDRDLLLEKYTLSNPFSALPMVDNEGLLMFYCSQFMSDFVYYVEDLDTIAIVEYSEDAMICNDIFCADGKNMEDILSALMAENTSNIILGFTPKNTGNYIITPLEEEDLTLFVLTGKDNIFADNKLRFPALSHA